MTHLLSWEVIFEKTLQESQFEVIGEGENVELWVKKIDKSAKLLAANQCHRGREIKEGACLYDLYDTMLCTGGISISHIVTISSCVATEGYDCLYGLRWCLSSSTRREQPWSQELCTGEDPHLAEVAELVAAVPDEGE